MIRVELFTKEDCGLCEEVKHTLLEVQRELPFELIEHDITRDPELFERYRHEIPVVHVDGHRAFKYRLEPQAFRARLERARSKRSMDTPKLQPLVSPWTRLVFLGLGLILAAAPLGESVALWLLGPVQPIPAALEGERMDTMASAFSLEDLAGRPVSLAEHRGKVVFVNFWASWCPPCVEELPSILRLHQAMSGRNFEVLAVSEDDTMADVRKFFAGNPPPFPVLLDDGQRVTRTWGTTKFPETYVVDAEGRIISKFIGPRDWATPESIDYFRSITEG